MGYGFGYAVRKSIGAPNRHRTRTAHDTTGPRRTRRARSGLAADLHVKGLVDQIGAPLAVTDEKAHGD
jgi:hypothetical protein